MGWNGSNFDCGAKLASARMPPKKTSGATKGIVAGILVVLLPICVYFIVGHDTPPADLERNVAKPKPIATAKSTKVVRSTKQVPVSTNKVTQKPKRTYLGSEVVKTEVMTNGGVVIERLFTADGKRHRINHVPPSIFKHASDEYLGIVLSTPPGLPMAPLPDLTHDGGLEKAFLESLKEEIKINDDDSDEVKDIKAKVIAARESMDAMLRQGIGFAAVLENERKIHNENVTTRSQVMAEYTALLKSANPDDAETYRNRVNNILNQMGIEEIQPKKPKNEAQEQ